MALKHNVAATWKDIVVWHNVLGTWKKVALHHKVGTVWKQITTLLSASLPSSMYANDFTFVPTAAYAAIDVQSNGTWHATNGGSGTWLTGGVNSDFQVRLTGTGTTPGGSALNTWLACSSNHYWDLSTPGNNYGWKTFNGTLEIRMAAAPNTVLTSSTVTIEVMTEV